MGWKTMLADVTGSVDDHLLLRIAYLVAENRIRRDQIKGCVQLSDAKRQTLAEIGAKLGKENRSWGYDRIARALAELGDNIGNQTVA